MNSEDREGERERETFSLRTAQGLSCSLENFDLLCERGPTQLPPFSTHVSSYIAHSVSKYAYIANYCFVQQLQNFFAYCHKLKYDLYHFQLLLFRTARYTARTGQ